MEVIAQGIILLTFAVVVIGLAGLVVYVFYSAITDPDPFNIGLTVLMLLLIAYLWAVFYLGIHGA